MAGAAVDAAKAGLAVLQEAKDLVLCLDGTKRLQKRHRSIELVIENQSEYLLKFEDEYFNSGTWFSQPNIDVGPKEVTIAAVANRQAAWFHGVTGGMAWKIGDTKKFLVLGFTHPFIGSFKNWIGVRDKADARYGYKQCRDDKVKTDNVNGFTLQAQIQASDIADRRLIFRIK